MAARVLDRDPIPLDADPKEQQRRINEARLRLADVIAVLNLPSMDDVEPQVVAALHDLSTVIDELRLILHVRRLEETDLDDQVTELETKLERGWKPDAEPVGDLVASLKNEFGLD